MGSMQAQAILPDPEGKTNVLSGHAEPADSQLPELAVLSTCS